MSEEHKKLVREYLEAKELLETFIENHEIVFDTYKSLVDDHNQKLQAADKAVRATGKSEGPWDQYQTQVTYDASALYDALGREDFLKVGGSIQTVSVYSLDKARFEAAITRKEVAEKVVDLGKKETKKYKAPKPVTTL